MNTVNIFSLDIEPEYNWLELNGQLLFLRTEWLWCNVLTYYPSAIGAHVLIPVSEPMRCLLEAAEMFLGGTVFRGWTVQATVNNNLIRTERPRGGPGQLAGGWYRFMIDCSLLTCDARTKTVMIHPELTYYDWSFDASDI